MPSQVAQPPEAIPSQEKTRSALVALLGERATPMTLSEVRMGLRRRGHRRADHEVVRLLSDLRSEGLVQHTRARWTVSNNNGQRKRLTTDSPTSLVSPLHTAIGTAATSADGDWSPGESSLLNGLPPQEQAGPWATFRRLLNYYMDCVRNDNGCDASAELSDSGRKFVPLSRTGRWYPQAGSRWRTHILATEATRGLISALGGMGNDGVLVLGYPIWFYTRAADEEDSSPFLKPIFTYSLEYDFRADGLEVWSDDPIADVNLDWLSFALKKPEQQRSFLTACGLMDRRGRDEPLGDGSWDNLRPDFQALATAVMTFFGDQVRESLVPQLVESQRIEERPDTGIYNKAALMIAKRTPYVRSLLKDLTRIRDFSDDELDRTALRPIFRDGRDYERDKGDEETTRGAESSQPHEGVVRDICEMNGEQREAVASLVRNDLSVVTGPPGTGKSQVVAAALGNIRLVGQSALFASRNHKAIDAVVSRPEMRTDDDIPLIVRANDRETNVSFNFADAIGQLLSDPFGDTASEKLTIAKKQIQEQLEKRLHFARDARAASVLRDELETLENELSTLSEEWQEEGVLALDGASDVFPSWEAASLVGRFALLERSPAQAKWWRHPIWWWRGRRVLGLARRVEGLLASGFSVWAGSLPDDVSGNKEIFSRWVRQLQDLARYCELRQLQRPLEEEAAALRSVESLAPEIEQCTAKIAVLARRTLSIDATSRMGLSPSSDRSYFASLRTALKKYPNALAPDSIRQEAKRALETSLPDLIRHFPTWAVTNLSVGSRIPLIPAMFDLAVVDEASQCDIPSAIPILLRARRAAVVGDPLQLAHVTRLTRSRDNVLAKRHGIVTLQEQRFSYIDTSLFDLFSETNGVTPVLLRDHYRCAPAIAEYSSQVFYGSRLRIVTAADRLQVPPRYKPGIHWTEVTSEFQARATGCVAPQEVETCVALLKRLLLEDAFSGTVGLVTPFRHQKQMLQEAILRDPQLVQAADRAHLLVDTAHGFQGDQRDVMFLSLCAGAGMPSRSLGWFRENGNLMNVAATRAQAVLHVVGDRGWAIRSGIPHVVALCRTDPGPKTNQKAHKKPFESPWERRLYDALVTQGLAPIPQYPLLGRRLDLALVEEGHQPIDIEVDGARYHLEPDGSRKKDDIWRDIIIRGADWKVMRFWVYELRDDIGACVERVLQEWREDERK